jgi:hypothetical protein
MSFAAFCPAGQTPRQFIAYMLANMNARNTSQAQMHNIKALDLVIKALDRIGSGAVL